MAKKKSNLSCPSCRHELLEVLGRCSGVIVKCPNCGASILADVDESGRMIVKYEPVDDSVKKKPAVVNA